MDSIEQRLTRLERKANRWRNVAVLLLLGVIARMSIGADPFADTSVEQLKSIKFEEIVCRRLVLEDAKGERRASLGTSGDAAAFILSSKDRLIILSADDNSAGVDICQKTADAKKIISMAATDKSASFSIGTSEDRYSGMFGRLGEGVSLNLETLGKPVVTLKSAAAGGFGWFSNLDLAPKIYVITPQSAKATSISEMEK